MRNSRLAGDTGSLKERSMRLRFFCRPPALISANNTIGLRPRSDVLPRRAALSAPQDFRLLRLGARELLKMLGHNTNMTPEAAAAEIRIDLPTGSYVRPEFSLYITHR